MLLDPVIGESVDERFEITARPRVLPAEVQVARTGSLVAATVGEVAGDVIHLAGGRLDDLAYTVVLLAALAAENQRQQHSLPVPRDELLPL